MKVINTLTMDMVKMDMIAIIMIDIKIMTIKIMMNGLTKTNGKTSNKLMEPI